MSERAEIAEYLDNLRALLAAGQPRFALMVERQVQFALLPHLAGTRAQLEPHLWQLLILCLDGPAADAPPCDETQWNRATTAAAARQALSGATPARYPQAAQAVAATLGVLREFGVFPKPKLRAG